MKIIVVGAGYAGCEVAHAVQDFADVTVIDPKPAFVHSAGMIRGLTDEKITEASIIPYDSFLSGGQVIQAKAKNIRAKSVVLDNGETVTGDAIVVATGSFHSTCFKAGEDGFDQFRANHLKVRDKIKSASTIAIVGAGAVGTELAGELATADPSRKIHLITDQSSLFPMYTEGLGRKLQAKLKRLGVEVHLNSKVDGLESWTEPCAGKVVLSGGKIIDADLIIPAVGSRPNANLLKTLNDVQLDDLGRVMTDDHMRPSASHPGLFALGDVAALGDGMTIVAISRQVPWLTKTLKKISEGAPVESLPVYKPWSVAPILLPLGPKTGASVLPFGKNGFAVGNFLTAKIKGEKLFIPKYRKLLGR